MGHSIKPSKSLRPKSLSYSRAKPIHDMTFFILSLSWLAERYVGGFKDKLSLRKHPFLFALRRWGRLAQRNVCDSATEIPYWWRKIWPESGQKRWLVDGVVTLFSYCLRMTDIRQKATEVKCKREESLTKQSIFVEYSLLKKREFELADEQNTLPKSTRRHVKLDKFYIWSPWFASSMVKNKRRASHDSYTKSY